MHTDTLVVKLARIAIAGGRGMDGDMVAERKTRQRSIF